MSVVGDRIRIYELAKQLKQDVKRIIEEARRLGENVSVPSNSVSKETAEEILNLNFQINEKEIAFGLHQYEKEPLISLTTGKEFPKVTVRLLGYKRKSCELQPSLPKTVENIRAVTKKEHLVESKPESQVNNNKNQLSENFIELFKRLSFSEIVSYIEKFLEDLQQSHDFPNVRTHIRFNKMISLLKKKVDLNTNESEAKLEIIRRLKKKEQLIYKEKKKDEIQESKKKNPTNKIQNTKNEKAVNRTEKALLNKYKMKSFEEIRNYLYDCLDKLSQKRYDNNQILQKESSYDELIHLLRKKLPSKIFSISVKEIRDRANKELTAQIDSLEMKKRRIFSKLDKEKVNFYKSQVSLLKVNNEPQHIENRVPIHTEKLNWTFLPTGEWGFEHIVKHFKSLISKGKWSGREVDETRLVMIESYLNPTHRYVGEKEFEGYVVYCFDKTEKKVILECPFYGNATYIIRGDWKEITKSSKWVAKYKHSNQVTVINHSKTWFERLRQNLNRSY